MWVNLNAGTGNLEVTNDPTGVNNKELIPKANIEGIFPMGIINKPGTPDDAYWIYPYPQITMVTVLIRGGSHQRKLMIELQSVVNQAGWSTGTQVGINQCVVDFSAFI